MKLESKVEPSTEGSLTVKTFSASFLTMLTGISSLKLCAGVCLLISTSVSYALEWSGAFENDVEVNACVGQNVSLPWSFTIQDGESLVDIEWYQQLPGQNEVIIAIFASGRFFSERENVAFIPNAGLLLLNAALGDTGTYSVRINSLDSSDLEPIHTRTAHLVVAVAPETNDGALHLHQREEAVLNTTTNEWHVQLSCGTFSSLGQPPVSVVWTTPSGQTHSSSVYVEGAFILTLTNPVDTGNYSCSVPHQLPAAMCLASDSPLLDRAKVHVDGVKVRLSLLEARQKELVAENFILHQTSEILLVENSQLTANVQRLTEELQLIQQNTEIVDILQHPTSCVDVQQYDKHSGVHRLYANGYVPIKVYCDQSTDSGGWTVFQRRQDGSVNFYRRWFDYQYGFGDMLGEFWLGLESLHLMTSQKRYELRVDLEDFEGNRTFAVFSNLRISDRMDNYTLHYDNFTSGTAGDSLFYQNGCQFTSWDADHDLYPTENCAVVYHGAWWYKDCHHSNLNGDYKHTSSAPLVDGVSWNTFRGENYSLKFTEMKIRPM